jgi:hypothetical protein
MQKLNCVCLDPNTGKARATATVTVFLAGTATLATLYAPNETTVLSNPLIADATGRVAFKANDGVYDIRVSGTGFTAYQYDEVQFMDKDNYLPISFTAAPIGLHTHADVTQGGQLVLTTAIVLTGPANGGTVLHGDSSWRMSPMAQYQATQQGATWFL